jgi:hypothetical protein
MPALQVSEPLSETPQPITDEAGTASSIVMSSASVGIGAAKPRDGAGGRRRRISGGVACMRTHAEI